MAGLMGTRSWVDSQSGRVTTEGKANAARRNGRRAGGPSAGGEHWGAREG
jgi:hypothetical protein